MLARLRVWLFARLVPLAPAALGELRSAELFSRLRADVDALEHAYLGVLIPLLVVVVVTLVVLALTLLYLPLLAVPLLLLFGIGGVLLPRWALRRGRAPGVVIVQCGEALRALAADGLRGRAELALYGAEAAHAERLAAVAARQRPAQRRIESLQALGSAGVMLAAQVSVTCVLLCGLPALRSGDLAAPDLTMLALLALAAFEAIAPLPEAWAQLGATLASARHVFALADTRPPVVEVQTPSPSIRRHDLCLRAVAPALRCTTCVGARRRRSRFAARAAAGAGRTVRRRQEQLDRRADAAVPVPGIDHPGRHAARCLAWR